jgi:hypothetical protein
MRVRLVESLPELDSPHGKTVIYHPRSRLWAPEEELFF